jgi:hypothetical protein
VNDFGAFANFSCEPLVGLDIFRSKELIHIVFLFSVGDFYHMCILFAPIALTWYLPQILFIQPSFYCLWNPFQVLA